MHRLPQGHHPQPNPPCQQTSPCHPSGDGFRPSPLPDGSPHPLSSRSHPWARRFGRTLLGTLALSTGLLSGLPGGWLNESPSAIARPLSPQAVTPPPATNPATNPPQASTRIPQLERAWQQQFEQYHQGKYALQNLSVPEIQTALGQLDRQTRQKTGLIYALSTPNGLELHLLTASASPARSSQSSASPANTSPRSLLIPAATPTRLTDSIRQLRSSILRSDSLPSEYLPPAQSLYQWLIAPLEADLKRHNITALVFCLGQGLRTLPLAALHDQQRFLSDRYGLTLIPAFNLLDRRPTALKTSRVLAMGASEFADSGLGPLPAVPEELATVTRSPWQGEIWLNQTFTPAKLRERRPKGFSIVHLATHADIADGPITQSFIQFGNGKVGLDQLPSLGLRSPTLELLVLSACRTALDSPQAELGFAGLAVQSGSKAVLASLWSISDNGTLALMTEFYRTLHKAPTKAIALSQAQQALHRNPRAPFAHPYYWAGFTLVGNGW